MKIVNKSNRKMPRHAPFNLLEVGEAKEENKQTMTDVLGNQSLFWISLTHTKGSPSLFLPLKPHPFFATSSKPSPFFSHQKKTGSYNTHTKTTRGERERGEIREPERVEDAY